MSPDHWPINARQWHLLGPPLRPATEDLRIVEAAAEVWRLDHRHSSLRALILGVTPELGTLAWPPGTSLVAVDRSEEMIRRVWPQSGLPAQTEVVRADWLSMPLEDGAFDLAAGDGCLSTLAFPDEYRAFCRQVRRVLVPEGRCVLRVFVAPAERESVHAIEQDLWAGRIESFHVLKWRLLMALLRPGERAVRLGDAWNAWRQLCPQPTLLAETLGWRPEAIATIEGYRDAPASYTFPTLGDVREILSEGMSEIGSHTPTYELGERCPTLVLTPRAPI